MTAQSPPASARRTVLALGSAQTLSWASSYYLPAVLAAPMAREFALATPTVFVAFSMALIVSAAVGPAAGRAIDRHGGRALLMGTNALFALALLGMGLATDPVSLFAAWLLMGVAMGAGLYDAAFATLVRLYAGASRNPITGITLIAGFASTVGWPLSAWMESQIGWRGACLGWAALHVLVGVPLNSLVPRARAAGGDSDVPTSPIASEQAPPTVPQAKEPGTAGPVPAQPRYALRNAVLLALVFAIVWFVSTAMAAHLPAMLQAGGASLAAAVAVGALVGPAQVGGRLLEFGLLRRVHPLLSARLAGLTHPLGVLALVLLGPAAAPAFAVLHGAGNGIMTIAKGTLPLALFGAQGYGARQGWIAMPARVAQAAAPVAFGLALERYGAAAMGLSAALMLVAFAALMLVRHEAGR